jgi:hypothetical protein
MNLEHGRAGEYPARPFAGNLGNLMKIKHTRILFCLLLTLLPAAVVQAQFMFITNDDNTIMITRYTGTNGDVVIPDTTNGYPVTRISWGAFSTPNATNVSIPDSVTSIEDEAFYGCVNLAGITIPGSITNIGVGAFNSCFSLTNISIPASVISIGDYAFIFCTNLTAIAVDAANPSYSSADGVLFNKDQTVLMQFPLGKAGSYAIPGTVTSLADESFGINDYGQYPSRYSACTGLTNLIIPGSVTNIGDSAFCHCTGLISVTLGKGVATIGTNAFSWCSNLIGITIPSSVTSIDELAFYYSGLTQVTIPGSVTNFGLGAFAVCSGLTSVTMQEGVTSIGEAGFNFCTNLTGMVIPCSLTSIGDRAFWFCTGLTNITIPRHVASIGSYAFSGCASLKNISVSTKNLFYSSVDGVLCSKDQTTLIQFPGGRGGSFRVPNGITTIGDYAFGTYDPSDYSFFYAPAYVNLTNIIVPSGVTTIGNDNYNSLNNLTAIYFEGDAPFDVSSLFYNFNITVYCLPGSAGWDDFANITPWLPQMQTTDTSFGVQTNQFGFNINWASDQTVVVDASTNLVNWEPVQTNTLTGGSAWFSDPQWTNYPGRFYRLRSP